MIDTGTKIALGVGAGVVVLGMWAARKVSDDAGDAVGAVGDAITPTNPDNIFSRGVNAVVDLLDDGQDNDSATLGTKVFDWFNPEASRELANDVRKRGQSGS